MPTLNIKNPRVYELARQIADATGDSMTSVIEQALADKLQALDGQRAERLAAIDSILDEMARRLGPLDGRDPTAFLYDEDTGLPR